MNDAALLAVHDLHIQHRVGGGERTLVRGVSFDVGIGETVGLVGESGSWKTLTARALVSLLPDGLTTRGSVSLDGRELVGPDGRVSARVRGREIGLLMQDPFTMLNPMMTAGRHIAETLRNVGAAARGAALRGEIERRLAEVGITDPAVAHRYPFELSGGMAQRVALAAVLAADPRLLLADEPSTALDATTQREILDLLLRLQQQRQMSLVLITHDLRLAFSVCRRVLVMYAGSIVESAPADELRDAPAHPYSRGLLATSARARIPSVDGRASGAAAGGVGRDGPGARGDGSVPGEGARPCVHRDGCGCRRAEASRDLRGRDLRADRRRLRSPRGCVGSMRR